MDKNIDLEERRDIEAELADPASFYDNKVLEVSFEKKESIIRSITNKNICISRKNFDESENTLSNFRI